MSEKKSLVEEALLQMDNLQEALTENAKGILASTMKEEISELVKESFVEPNEGDEEIETSETEMTEQGVAVDDLEDEDTEELDLDLGELGMDSDNEEMDSEDEDEMIDDEEMLMDLSGDELGVDDEDEELLPLDLTSASDDEILKVFKHMGQEDGVIVTQDDDNIKLSDEETDSEYIIQMESKKSDLNLLSEEENEDDEIVYEITLDEEENDELSEEWNEEDENLGRRDSVEESETEEEDEVIEEVEDTEEEDDDDSSKEETQEASIRSHVNRRQKTKKPQGFKMGNYKTNESLEREVNTLKSKNEEYRKALNIFKEKLNEVAVFNSNLAYATRLFTEHSTTKKEKINILRRFDSVESLKESKSLYKILKEEFGSKEVNMVTENVKPIVDSTPSKGSATNLIESKTYENPQFQRMKDLMNKIK
jgi:hypothetical protein